MLDAKILYAGFDQKSGWYIKRTTRAKGVTRSGSKDPLSVPIMIQSSEISYQTMKVRFVGRLDLIEFFDQIFGSEESLVDWSVR